jgi:hypothetical protein
VLQQAMDRDPNRRPNTAGELLDHLEMAIHSPNGTPDIARWLKPAIRVRGIGIGALVLLAVGVAEVAWLFEGPGWSMVMRASHRLFGVG